MLHWILRVLEGLSNATIAFLPWITAFHVISVILWMAGLLFLFRLFLHHQAETESVCRERFETMERWWFRVVADPAQIAAWTFGLWLVAIQPHLWQERWAYVKLGLVSLLTGVHYLAPVIQQRLAEGKPTPSRNALRSLAIVPTLLMIATVIVVMVKPW